jgi:hypothetical protein
MTQRLKGKIRQPDTIVAQTVKIGDALKLGDLSDVNVTGESDGVMLIYSGTSGKYEVTTNINNENLNIIGGTY